MIADGLTKALSKQEHAKFIKQLGMVLKGKNAVEIHSEGPE
jgi:hypothetical protein